MNMKSYPNNRQKIIALDIVVTNIHESADRDAMRASASLSSTFRFPKSFREMIEWYLAVPSGTFVAVVNSLQYLILWSSVSQVISRLS